ncbi:trans-sulfuration enzyme family protein [Heyndrickxia acidicola]|uniref:Aminotransferase class V-fold PLP-dependent enzyme n=1 Tax=Heyndrickxia acidicola TaxID=209389 RepID=A0ABU6MJA9_9BACI|nr:aminotransferase class V-fold PLP-dependent enzyme [Heyndrickxia acidicola]MED1204404.1 aminotransferase class V-fold PLP-dependent enzyme [Heyndrickxia acidicola]
MESSLDTRIVHSFQENASDIGNESAPSYQTSSFSFASLEELEKYFKLYQGDSANRASQPGNAVIDELGQAVAMLEGAPAGVAAATGTSAVLTGIMATVSAGDHIIAAEDIFGGTYRLLSQELKHFGVETTFISFHDLEAVRKAIRPNTRLLYSETVTNPFLRVEDIDGVVQIAKENGLLTMIDNLYATPYLSQPFKKGVDLVVHSSAKFIGGHSDAAAGVLAGSEPLIQKVREKIVNIGAQLSPFEAWMTCRGIKTLGLRMEKQTTNAQVLADALMGNPLVSRVYYPEFVSKRGNGAVITIELMDQCDIHRFFSSLNWVKIVPSFAGVETTVSYPLGTSHRALSPEMQRKIGITKQVVRITLGIENSKDIIEQFEAALRQSAE